MLPPAFSRSACLLGIALTLEVAAQTPAVESAAPPIQAPASAQAPAPASYEADPKFRSAIAEAHKLLQQHDSVFAIDPFKKAVKISGGQCVSCLHELYDLQLRMAAYKDAATTASALEAAASTPVQKSRAETGHARALYLQAGDKPKPAQLTAIDTILKAALADAPSNNNAHYIDGCVLARLGQTEAASEQFNLCAKTMPRSDPTYVRVRHFAENPSLSLSKMAPPIAVTALDGTRFNLDEMGGRVVLVDFWATWCGPCNAELPHMRKIAKDFAGQPFVIVSISWDDDATKWKDFVTRNEMTWLQYRDADHSLSKAFGVEAIPHYFTIDSDGVLTAEILGSGNDVEGKLKKLVARARAAAPPPSTVATNATGATP